MKPAFIKEQLFVTHAIGLMRQYLGTAVFLTIGGIFILFKSAFDADWKGTALALVFILMALLFGWVSSRLAQVTLDSEGIKIRRLFESKVKAAAEFERVEAFGSTLIVIRFRDGENVYGMENPNFVYEMIPAEFFEAADKEWKGWMPRSLLRQHRAYLELRRNRADIELMNQKISAWADSY